MYWIMPLPNSRLGEGGVLCWKSYAYSLLALKLDLYLSQQGNKDSPNP